LNISEIKYSFLEVSMTATQVEWTYDSVHGEIVDVYLFQSEILAVPLSEGEVINIACNDAMADFEARCLVEDK
jgi:hypothetical protein